MHLPADFDPSVPEKKRGALRSVLGGENVQSDCESHGSATTLSFNCDNTRLLVGHAKGQVGGAPLAGGRGTANWWEGHTLFAGCASLHVPIPLSCRPPAGPVGCRKCGLSERRLLCPPQECLHIAGQGGRPITP